MIYSAHNVVYLYKYVQKYFNEVQIDVFRKFESGG